MSPEFHQAINAQKALIFRITHRQNIPWLLRNGLCCSNGETKDPDFVSIGNPDLIDKRSTREVPLPPGGTLADYVPFYFTPFSPMLYNIKTGYGDITQRENDEIVFLVSSLRDLQANSIPFVFTDRHAYLQTARFSAELGELDMIDWALLQQRDFRRDPEDRGKIERYQAEALIHRQLAPSALLGITCYNDQVRKDIASEAASRGLDLKIVKRQGWYF